MINIMHKQIINLFTDPIKTMSNGLWFSGYREKGEYKLWYKDGKLNTHLFYENNVLNGEYKEWHDNGQLFKHCFFKDGKYNGEYKEWHKNGKPREHYFYKDNKEYTIKDAKQKFPEGPWL